MLCYMVSCQKMFIKMFIALFFSFFCPFSMIDASMLVYCQVVLHMWVLVVLLSRTPAPDTDTEAGKQQELPDIV